jgi:hypothetical protein
MAKLPPIEIPVIMSLAEARAELDGFTKKIREADANEEVLKKTR